MKKKKLQLQTHEGMIYFGDDGINPIWQWRIPDFEIAEKYHFLEQQKLKLYFDDSKINCEIIIYLSMIYKLGFDITVLINEINKSQENDIYSYKHSLSLIKVCYHYLKKQVNVVANKTLADKKSPDLIINDITCDLKVRHDQTFLRYKNIDPIDIQEQTKDFNPVIKTPLQDLIAAIKSRAEKGFSQADSLIFDLSDHFHSWNYHRLLTYQKNGIEYIKDEPIIPTKGSIIIFSPKNTNVAENESFIPKAKWIQIQL